jgi:chromosomal replication initiation ATPase DnaA
MPGVSSSRQLALALEHSESFAREDFLEGPPNKAALARIESFPNWPDRIMALVGPQGAGKSHLAAIWVGQAGARFVAGRALEAASVPAVLATGAVVVEDLAAGTFDERALFHLLNMAREEGAFVLLTARTAPASWTMSVPDLGSRLRSIPVIALSAPDDELLRALIVKLFADRQLAIDESLVGYLVTRIERSFAAARAAVDMLDREALRRQRPANRALAAELWRDQTA